MFVAELLNEFVSLIELFLKIESFSKDSEFIPWQLT